jgi:hypothetical protein
VFLNVLGNSDISNDCLLYSIRAFTACLITVFPILAMLFLLGFVILEYLVKCFKEMCLNRTEVEDKEDPNTENV